MTLRPLRTFELTIPSRLEELESVQKLIGEATAAFGLGEDIAYWMELTVSESVINAIRHGNRNDTTKHVHVCCKLSPQRLWIRIVDEGPGFNPEMVADCTDIENLDVPSGRGIMLMRSFMSRVEYNERGNGVEMEKERAADPA